MHFRLRFKLEKHAQGLALLRQGRVELLTPSGNFIQDELLRVGFEAMLLARFEIGRITVPTANIGTLEPAVARAANGWLLVLLHSRD